MLHIGRIHITKDIMVVDMDMDMVGGVGVDIDGVDGMAVVMVGKK
jgi:hypothetical protein